MGGNQVRFNAEKCKRDKLVKLIAYIKFCYLETGHGMAAINFNRFSVAGYCILVICQKKLSMPLKTL